MAATYHGNTSLVSQLSKPKIPPVSFGLGQYYRFVDAPDSYRNPTLMEQSLPFRSPINQVEALNEDGTGFAALVVSPYFLHEGFPDHPDGWLAETGG